MQRVNLLLVKPPRGAGAEIGELTGLIGRVLFRSHELEARGELLRFILLQLGLLDQPSAERHRILLILTGEVVLTQIGANLSERVERFALRVQRLAGTAGVAGARRSGSRCRAEEGR